MSERIESGTLYVVSTPIGNLEDFSSRGAKILAGVDLIAAEDTRTTGVLLKHLGISRPQVSFHVHNEQRKVAGLVARLQEGGSVALVTDAGTPGISDPAFSIVRSALAEGIRVVAIPGASALLAALVVSGLPMDRFAFEGFLPVKKGRETRLGRLADEERTIVLYEAPHRLLRTLEDLFRVCGDREVAVARELTKKFEEVRRGSLTRVLEHFRAHSPRGEFVVVIAGRRRGENRHVGDGIPTEVEDGKEEGTEAG
jgi:16S rRNA (cytidine1402-2'-O)-methyltransferase